MRNISMSHVDSGRKVRHERIKPMIGQPTWPLSVVEPARRLAFDGVLVTGVFYPHRLVVLAR